ncbi:MAG: polyphenol oxidase family protein [Bacteriovoracaceae bacterium]|nr:polyphenol oxidase family protein [Bacteriovoracaceae bacterium]
MKAIFEKKIFNGTYKVYGEKPNFDFKKVHQIHSDQIIDLKDELHPETVQVDGMVASLNFKVPLVIVTADCLPILIQGSEGICFLHAGWKGLENKILSHSLVKKIKPTQAFIGPHICQNHYEVGPEFLEYFKDSNSVITQDNKHYFDLGQEAEFQLNKLFPGISVENSNLCTYTENNLHSYRKNKTELRNWNVFLYSD